MRYIDRHLIVIATLLLCATQAACDWLWPFVDEKEPARDASLDWRQLLDGAGGQQPGPTKNIDILFVIDNSNSMGEEQQSLSDNFDKLIDALRSPKFGADGSGKLCTAADVSGCKIPNVRIGVVTTDLGGGDYTSPACQVDGDGGKLQSSARGGNCLTPNQAWIEYNEGKTNIAGGGEPIAQVKAAFQCIATFGTGGCGFEHQLEAARRALDPQRNVNPGFLRDDAYLAVVFITDEDDCSAQKPGLFATTSTGPEDPLGPVDSFRCFEFGVRCDINDRFVEGPRQHCQPAFDWLYPVGDYVTFFTGLKPPGRVLMFAIAGPLTTFEVKIHGTGADRVFELAPSCSSTRGSAVPALRIKTVLDGLGPQGHFNEGITLSGQAEPVDICSPDFSPALRLIGKVIGASLGT